MLSYPRSISCDGYLYSESEAVSRRAGIRRSLGQREVLAIAGRKVDQVCCNERDVEVLKDRISPAQFQAPGAKQTSLDAKSLTRTSASTAAGLAIEDRTDPNCLD